MTEEQIFSVFIRNGCLAIPSGLYVTEWYLSEKDNSWGDKIGAMMPSIKKFAFGEKINANINMDNVFSFDDLTPEFIEQQINLMRKREKLIIINERLKDLEKDFVKEQSIFRKRIIRSCKIFNGQNRYILW